MSPPCSRSHGSTLLGLAILPFPPESPASQYRPAHSLSPTSISASLTGPRTPPLGTCMATALGSLLRRCHSTLWPWPSFPPLVSAQPVSIPTSRPGLYTAAQDLLLGLINYSELLSHPVRAPPSLCQLERTQKHVDHRY